MSDLIRKLSVLELIDDYNSDALGSVFIDYSHGLKFKRAVLKLPSAEPVIRCKDCKHYNAEYECLIEGYGIERDKDWFCGDAERKEDE